MDRGLRLELRDRERGEVWANTRQRAAECLGGETEKGGVNDGGMEK